MVDKLILDESEAVDTEEVVVADTEEPKEEVEQSVEVVSKGENEESEEVEDVQEFSKYADNDYLQQTLINLIKSEWDAYQQYKSAMLSFKLPDINKDSGVNLNSVANILTDIANEELIHVGQLQKALDLFQKNLAKQLASGNSEADEQISEEKVEK